MSFIDGSVRISELSIPDTYGSMARYFTLNISQELVLNQRMPLITQLNAGIQHLDIRCRHYHNQFAIHHRMVIARLLQRELSQVKNLIRS